MPRRESDGCQGIPLAPLTLREGGNLPLVKQLPEHPPLASHRAPLR